MTTITVTAPEGRITKDQRQELSTSLTDAVLIVEVGQLEPLARLGFQVHFRELPTDSMAINGMLVSDDEQDVMVIDVAVMDGDWPQSDRTKVIENLYAALTKSLKMDAPSPNWWIQFRTIDEGSWGANGGVISILDLLETGVFTEEKAAAIRKAIKS